MYLYDASHARSGYLLAPPVAVARTAAEVLQALGTAEIFPAGAGIDAVAPPRPRVDAIHAGGIELEAAVAMAGAAAAAAGAGPVVPVRGD